MAGGLLSAVASGRDQRSAAASGDNFLLLGIGPGLLVLLRWPLLRRMVLLIFLTYS